MKSPWSWVPSLYFAEGLPYVVVMSLSLIFFHRMGLSNDDVTLYTSWLYLPWVIKPLWSPVVELFSTRRRWILVMQLLIGAAFGGVAFTLPTDFWFQGSLFFFWVMAFGSATHDIAADGFYMLGLTEHSQAQFVGIRSTFYRISTLFGQGALLLLAGSLQGFFHLSVPYTWMLVFYGICALFLFLMLWHTAALPRPADDRTPAAHPSLRGFFSELWHLIVSFVTKYPLRETIFALAFMLFYRMPEGLLAKVSALFLMDTDHGLGLSDTQLGLAQGTVGVLGLTFGGILGGLCAARHGLRRWLWPMVCAITLPDLVYVYMSLSFPDASTWGGLFLINLCILIEQFGYGFGFTAYMLYLIYYSRGAYRTSHYALCTAFMALSMMLPGLVAGKLQMMVGYPLFFTLVFCACAVTFIVAALIRIDPSFGKKSD